jgi:hypothetical protein
MLLTDGLVILIWFFEFTKQFIVPQLQGGKAASRRSWCYSGAFILACCAHFGAFSDSYVLTISIASWYRYGAVLMKILVSTTLTFKPLLVY